MFSAKILLIIIYYKNAYKFDKAIPKIRKLARDVYIIKQKRRKIGVDYSSVTVDDQNRLVVIGAIELFISIDPIAYREGRMVFKCPANRYRKIIIKIPCLTTYWSGSRPITTKPSNTYTFIHEACFSLTYNNISYVISLKDTDYSKYDNNMNTIVDYFDNLL